MRKKKKHVDTGKTVSAESLFDPNTCTVCGKSVQMQVMKGTGLCSLNCAEKKSE